MVSLTPVTAACKVKVTNPIVGFIWDGNEMIAMSKWDDRPATKALKSRGVRQIVINSKLAIHLRIVDEFNAVSVRTYFSPVIYTVCVDTTSFK